MLPLPTSTYLTCIPSLVVDRVLKPHCPTSDFIKWLSGSTKQRLRPSLLSGTQPIVPFACRTSADSKRPSSETSLELRAFLAAGVVCRCRAESQLGSRPAWIYITGRLAESQPRSSDIAKHTVARFRPIDSRVQ